MSTSSRSWLANAASPDCTGDGGARQGGLALRNTPGRRFLRLDTPPRDDCDRSLAGRERCNDENEAPAWPFCVSLRDYADPFVSGQSRVRISNASDRGSASAGPRPRKGVSVVGGLGTSPALRPLRAGAAEGIAVERRRHSAGMCGVQSWCCESCSLAMMPRLERAPN